MKTNLAIWINKRGLRIEDLIGVLKKYDQKTPIAKSTVYAIVLGTSKIRKRYIDQIKEKFGLTEKEENFLLSKKEETSEIYSKEVMDKFRKLTKQNFPRAMSLKEVLTLLKLIKENSNEA